MAKQIDHDGSVRPMRVRPALRRARYKSGAQSLFIGRLRCFSFPEWPLVRQSQVETVHSVLPIYTIKPWQTKTLSYSSLVLRDPEKRHLSSV